MVVEKKTRKPRAKKPKDELVREMKTMGVRLPDDVRDVLAQEAKRQNRSPSNLAATIIIEWARKLLGGGASQ